MSPKTRQYRHRNRRVPCDRCRHQKVRCRMLDGRLPCDRCRDNPAGCTFTKDSGSYTRSSSASLLQDEPSTGLVSSAHQSTSPNLSTLSPHISSSAQPSHETTPAEGVLSVHEDQWPFSAASIDQLLSTQALSTQISQSLDQIEGHHYQLCGGSSDQDPWLLRHCKFDEFGFRKFFKVHIRNAGGVPTRDKIPAHFLVVENGINDAAKAETRHGDYSNWRSELMQLVPVQQGNRLIQLFMKRIFPMLPILSRTHLGIYDGQVGDVHVLDKIPTHLLAAIYASALPFAHEDDYLCLLTTYEQPDIAKLWKMSYLLILDGIHTPTLSIVQAGILYLNRKVSTIPSHNLVDMTPIVSFLGTLLGVVHSLGLHLQCNLFGLPAQEKRLRRRLWWAIYIEDKWISMLLGRPPYIRSTEWDVVELSPGDFVVGSRSSATFHNARLPLSDMASLALIAEQVQENMYSLRMSQKLAEDVTGSIEAAKPLFRSLSSWRESLPSEYVIQGLSSEHKIPCPATLYFAYLTLVACVWRAVLRATVRSHEPAQIIDVHDLEEPCSVSMTDFTSELNLYPEADLQTALNCQENGTLIQELYEASLNCASTLVQFSANITTPAFSEFWYSWSRTSFALISNFLILLLVQAPDFTKASRAWQLLQRWREVLNSQCNVFPLSLPAKIRLASYFSVGLDEVFHLPPHVKQVLDASPWVG